MNTSEKTPMNNESLMALAIVEPMVREHHAPLRLFLLSHVHDHSTADDLAQDVFLSALRHSEQFDASRPAWPWLLGIARNRLREYWRESSREIVTDSVEAMVAEEEMLEPGKADEFEERRLTALRTCVEHLAPESRDLLNLAYGESLTGDDMAARLKRKVSAIRVALHRLRTWLRSCIETRMGATPA
jgi:RNA polymerase sigma-70 factor (ECF subfamily)